MINSILPGISKKNEILCNNVIRAAFYFIIIFSSALNISAQSNIGDFLISPDSSHYTSLNARIATDGNNNFTVVYKEIDHSFHPVNIGVIWGKQFNKDGLQMGEKFFWDHGQIYDLQIDMNDTGDFIIGWRDANKVYFQKYDSSHEPIDSSDITMDGRDMECRISSAGNFIVTWLKWNFDDTTSTGYLQLFDRDKNKLNGSIIVYSLNNFRALISQPIIDTDSSGNFVIAWDKLQLTENEPNGLKITSSNIYCQRYDKNGSAIGSILESANDSSGGILQTGGVGVSNSGSFAVVWLCDREDSSNIYYQLYDENGEKWGSSMRVNDNMDLNDDSLSTPVISSDEDGNFIIAWCYAINGNYDIYAQRYDNEGNRIGSNFRINQITEGSQQAADIELRDGRIYSTWYSNFENDEYSSGIWANVLDFNSPVGVESSESSLPSSFYLGQNYPNPFNPTTKIDYALKKESKVTIKVYDILGRLVKELVNTYKPAGNYTVTFDGSSLSSGIYFYRMETEQFVQTRKLMLMK